MKVQPHEEPLVLMQKMIQVDVDRFMAGYRGAPLLLVFELPFYVNDTVSAKKWMELHAKLIIKTDPPFASKRGGKPIRIVKRFYATVEL